jgi:hypothetical protein
VNDIVPEAYIDGLVILNDAPNSIVPISLQMLHLYAYLGCILALFKGTPAADWGYQFAVTSEGFPFSVALDHARATICSRGTADIDEGGQMRPRQPELAAELDAVMQIGSWHHRRVYLRTATECALALPIGAIRHAVSRSPGVSEAFFLGQRKRLLEPIDTSLLYQEYEIISQVLGGAEQDVLSPAVIWLSARILRRDGKEIEV